MNRWENYGRSLRKAASVSTVGLELALAVGVGYFIGDRVDTYLSTAPYGMIAFVIVGSVAGFLNLYRAMKRFQASQDED